MQLFIAHRLKGESLRLHYGGTKFSLRGNLCLFKCSKNNADICLKNNTKSKIIYQISTGGNFMSELKRTQLYDVHVAAGADMVDFGD